MFRYQRQIITFVASVVLSLALVSMMAFGATYIDVDSVGIATDTPGAALGVKGAGIFEGFVSAQYYTSTSTTNSWLLGDALGLGTTTPGLRLSVDGNIYGDIAHIDDHLRTSYFLATSTTATSTIGFGLTVDSTTLVVDASVNGVGIATSTLVSIGADRATLSIGAGTGSTTVFVAGGGALGGAMIFKDTDGNGCTMISFNDGALQTGDIACPK
ncbi:MAG: hypothetical protein G01um10143_122 [Parcubacteria group bacterium Gr01-1014_3]|nr:MAG: hypothetical protein G01um10143_122 [Parcubacteria group bacterium Gr01-1014_3]